MIFEAQKGTKQMMWYCTCITVFTVSAGIILKPDNVLPALYLSQSPTQKSSKVLVVQSSKTLVVVINFSIKSWQNFSKLILVITWDHKIRIQDHIRLSQPQRSSCWKKSSRRGRFLLKLTTWLRKCPVSKFWEW